MRPTCYHDLLEHPKLSGGLEADEVHAPLSAEVSSVEPVPVLKLVPGLPPGQEVVVVSDFAVRNTFKKNYILKPLILIFKNPFKQLHFMYCIIKFKIRFIIY